MQGEMQSKRWTASALTRNPLSGSPARTSRVRPETFATPAPAPPKAQALHEYPALQLIDQASRVEAKAVQERWIALGLYRSADGLWAEIQPQLKAPHKASPGRRPVHDLNVPIRMSCIRSDKPLNLTICSASALIRTVRPCQARTHLRLERARRPEAQHGRLRDGHEKDDLRWVSVIGPPAAIWRRNRGTTDPEEPSTLPKRTIEKGCWWPQQRGPAQLIQPNVWTPPSHWWGARLYQRKSTPPASRHWQLQTGTPD